MGSLRQGPLRSNAQTFFFNAAQNAIQGGVVARLRKCMQELPKLRCVRQADVLVSHCPYRQWRIESDGFMFKITGQNSAGNLECPIKKRVQLSDQSVSERPEVKLSATLSSSDRSSTGVFTSDKCVISELASSRL